MSWTMRPSALFTSKQFTSLAKIHPAVRLTTFSTLVQWNSQHPSRYGCTRPHAVPYWFWHAGSQKTFPSDIARSDIFIRARSDLVIHGGASCHGGTSLVLKICMQYNTFFPWTSRDYCARLDGYPWIPRFSSCYSSEFWGPKRLPTQVPGGDCLYHKCCEVCYYEKTRKGRHLVYSSVWFWRRWD